MRGELRALRVDAPHHITRLMVLSSLATLLDVSPRELRDWFWVAYTGGKQAS